MTARTPPARAPHRRASASASNGRAAMTAEHETAPCDFCRGRDARRGFSITRAGAYRCGRCTAGAADAAALHALREIVLDLGFGFSSAAGVAEDARQIARANAAPISRVAPLLGRAIVLRGHTGEAGAMLAQRIRAHGRARRAGSTRPRPPRLDAAPTDRRAARRAAPPPRKDRTP